MHAQLLQMLRVTRLQVVLHADCIPMALAIDMDAARDPDGEWLLPASDRWVAIASPFLWIGMPLIDGSELLSVHCLN